MTLNNIVVDGQSMDQGSNEAWSNASMSLSVLTQTRIGLSLHFQCNAVERSKSPQMMSAYNTCVLLNNNDNVRTIYEDCIMTVRDCVHL